MSTIDDDLSLCQNLTHLIAAAAEPEALGEQLPSSETMMAVMVTGEHLESLIEQVRVRLDEIEAAAKKAETETG